jgi:predicted Zn-dependent protease
MTAAQDLIDVALAASVADGSIVVVEERSEVHLRWAANTVTTSGQLDSRTMTAISVAGRSVGIVSRSVTSAAEAVGLVHAADALSRKTEPVDDAIELVEPYPVADDWGAEAATTGPEAFDRMVPELGHGFRRFQRRGRRLFGYAEHRMTTWFVGVSTGLRRRFDQADGRFELTASSSSPRRSSWHGAHVPDPASIDVAAALDEVERGLERAPAEIQLPAGRYETILPPAAVADLMLCAYGHVSARDAHEGRSVFAAPGGGNRIGDQICSLPLRLYSDPAAPGLECAPFVIPTTGDSTSESVFDTGQPVPAACANSPLRVRGREHTARRRAHWPATSSSPAAAGRWTR